MLDKFQFDYYYGIEAEQFSFYRIPRVLIKDKKFKNISTDAKLLYGLMLDRMAMSMKNGWVDDKNRVYIIYTLENVMEDLNCGKDKGVKVLAELDDVKGIGLIERKRRGLGKPAIIYVKNFIENKKHIFNKEFYNSENQNSQNEEVISTKYGKTEVLTSEKEETEVLKYETVDFGKSETNYNNIKYNNTKYNNTINPINPIMNDGIDYYVDIIKKNIEYDYYINSQNICDRKIVEELYKIICDIVCAEREYIIIGGNKYPYKLVKSRFLSIKQHHIEYILECMRKNTVKIKNIKSYLISVLYNAPLTINCYYNQEVNHDLYG
ncbi:hypothetical protein B5E58_04425 [Tyzzerella sp. An114]|uniref:DUF6017 domain-containing protein n=1 Tax=Tyzzerella sp. An114 TaxID=1965545 RepID=UPI000B438027|nr:DUF6017 domain-containing protein [Tyzzerella sp. An114]OUQ59687.1 hypothetical protein B5E58_04425 [Tyzzerella sp. An114]